VAHLTPRVFGIEANIVNGKNRGHVRQQQKLCPRLGDEAPTQSGSHAGCIGLKVFAFVLVLGVLANYINEAPKEMPSEPQIEAIPETSTGHPAMVNWPWYR
jgi:hypothetical protein